MHVHSTAVLILDLLNAALYRGGARSNRDYNAYDGGDEYYGNKPYYNEDGPPGDDPWGDFSPGKLLSIVHCKSHVLFPTFYLVCTLLYIHAVGHC
jgi:hypothetical protein